jgi:hypothetical protein
MNENIFEHKNCFNSFICDDIIENFEETNKNIFEIPKHNDKWVKIEKMIYKEILIKLNLYKNNLILKNTNESENLVLLLNETLHTKSFIIEKITPSNDEKETKYYNAKNNRFNVLSYIIYLNEPKQGGGIVLKEFLIKPECGKLVFINYDNYKDIHFKRPEHDIQYVIYGELCSNNVI